MTPFSVSLDIFLIIIIAKINRMDSKDTFKMSFLNLRFESDSKLKKLKFSSIFPSSLSIFFIVVFVEFLFLPTKESNCSRARSESPPISTA